jgi:hypothetical protein
LLEELGEVFFGGFLADAADKDLARSLLLFTGDSPLRIDL